MRAWFFVIALGWIFGTLHVEADPSHVVLKFDGTSPTTTSTFTVGDKWEIAWDSPLALRITLLSSDGTVVAGIAGVFKGSVYESKGGTFYLQIESGTHSAMAPWHISVTEVGSGSPNPEAVASNAYSVPATVLPPKPAAAITPSMALPPPNIPPAPPVPPPLVPAKFTDDQARAMVSIKGDNAEGTGFLVKTADGPAVVTNLHIIAGNPNIKIVTNTGEGIPILSLKGATDRDLAMVAIKDKDAKYSYLDLATDVGSNVQAGDDVLVSGNSQGIVNALTWKVAKVTPLQIEFGSFIVHGNSGSPVLYAKSGKVVGIVTEGAKLDISYGLEKIAFPDRYSAVNNSLRYAGLRLDDVQKWEPYDWKTFLSETTFLNQFHQQTRRLDAYLHARKNTPDAGLYLTDEKISAAHDTFVKKYSDAGNSQRAQSLKELLFELNGIADVDMKVIQGGDNFYAFEQLRANDEITSRMAIKKELDSLGNDMDKFGDIMDRKTQRNTEGEDNQ